MKATRRIILLAMVIIMAVFAVSPALAATSDQAQTTESVVAATEGKLKSTKAVAAGIAIAVVAAVGAFSMAHAISKSAESTSRQPEAAGPIKSNLMLGLVFIETAIIYALIVAILIIFVL